MTGSDHSTDHSAPDWDEFRRQMPVAKRWGYLDHAAVALLTRPAQLALEKWVNDATQNGDTCYPDWSRQVEQVRASAASMIGALTGCRGAATV